MGGDGGGGTQRSRGYHFLLGLALLRRKQKENILFTLREESVHRIRGPQYSFFRRALSHAHVNIQSAWEGAAGHFSIPMMPYNSKGYHADGLERAPPPHEKEKTHNTAS